MVINYLPLFSFYEMKYYRYGESGEHVAMSRQMRWTSKLRNVNGHLAESLSLLGSFFEKGKDERALEVSIKSYNFRIYIYIKKKEVRIRNHFVAVRLSNLLRYSRGEGGRENSNKLCRVAAERGVPVKQACGLSTSSVVAERLSCFATVTKWIIRGEGGRAARSLFAYENTHGPSSVGCVHHRAIKDDGTPVRAIRRVEGLSASSAGRRAERATASIAGYLAPYPTGYINKGTGVSVTRRDAVAHTLDSFLS